VGISPEENGLWYIAKIMYSFQVSFEQLVVVFQAPF